MRSLGFAIKKDELWYAVIDGEDLNSAEIIACEKHRFQSATKETDLMLCFYNLFNEVISRFTPSVISCKVSLNIKLSQIPYLHFPIGVLAYICKSKDIQFICRSNSWITSSKRKKEISCKKHFSDYNLTTEKLAAVVVAWYQLGESNG